MRRVHGCNRELGRGKTGISSGFMSAVDVTVQQGRAAGFLAVEWQILTEEDGDE